MRTIVLDDDPTGTQCATGARVLLGLDAAGPQTSRRILEAMRSTDAFYVQTNSRALDRSAAVALVSDIRQAAIDAAATLEVDVPRFVLRGDSTLRGHVFPESGAFATENSVLLFEPAFPAGGRTTERGVHYVEVDGERVPAAETEYATDPVFGFRSSSMTSYVREQGGPPNVICVPIDEVRASAGSAVAQALLSAPPDSVVVPDAVTDHDIRLVHRGLEEAWVAGRDVVVRSAAPLAAMCAGVYAKDLLAQPLPRPDGAVLVVCGSHTTGATAQVNALQAQFGIEVAVLDTDAALADPAAAGAELAAQARATLRLHGIAAIASDRHRRAADNTLGHGERVMAGLTTAVHQLRTEVAAVVAKGGITSAEVARAGLGAETALVRGQLINGVSLWDLYCDTGSIPYIVVPGNVGDSTSLVDVLQGMSIVPGATADIDRNG